MQLKVDKAWRLSKMRAHTVAHLLHQQLDKILWWTKQAWSYVDADYVRFDFTTNRPLSPQEIKEIEFNINDFIYQALDVQTKETTLDDAIKQWAKALFDEKYWNKVRLVCISWEGNAKATSLELCWWTHVQNTADIWAFKIIWQEAVASGIRRIIWITWPKVWNYWVEKDIELENISTKLDTNPKQLWQSIDKIIKEHEELKKEHESIQSQITLAQLTQIRWYMIKTQKHPKYWYYIMNVSSIAGNIAFNKIKDYIKDKFDWYNVLMYNDQWNYIIFKGNEKEKVDDAKTLAKTLWLKWWGSEIVVQWRDEKVKNIK